MIAKYETELKKIIDFENFGFTSSPPSSELHDYEFGKKVSALINQKYEFKRVESNQKSYFENNKADVEQRVNELINDGYSISNQKLVASGIDAINMASRNLVFKNKGKFSFALKGGVINLLNRARIGSMILSDTFWLRDYSDFCNEDVIKSIAYDPYILNVVGGYLGCPPILVQTNMWHSFPGGWISRLSGNGQAYHQDKEFVKFIKVFIYLTDVDISKGPHCYFVGSHHDEAIRFGYDYSSRISDEQCYKIYGKSRERIVTGNKGTVIFGDTSAVHKGMPIISGHRAIFQLEYSSTLYHSPVSKFNCPKPNLLHLNLGELFLDRITANYL